MIRFPSLTREDVLSERDPIRLLGMAIIFYDALEDIANTHVEQRDSVSPARLHELKAKARRALDPNVEQR